MEIKKEISNGVKKIYPYALISFIIGIVSYIQLLGMERAILAVVFGVVALKEINGNEELKGKKYAYWGIGLGILYLFIILVIIIFKRSELLSILNPK